MSTIIRMPGESWHDFERRLAERDGLDPDRAVGPATNGPRFAGETEAAWKERLASHAGFSAATGASETDDDTEDDR
jgi:hypothetical protein